MVFIDGYEPTDTAPIASSENDFPETCRQLPIKEKGELLIIVAYIHVNIQSQSEVKARAMLSETYRSIKTVLDDCGKDVRLIVMPTDKETKIECIYPTNKMI